jgi:hypothetical protein
LVDVADALPRTALRAVAGFLKATDGGSVWLWTALWIIIAAMSWGLAAGAVAFTVRWAGRSGGRLLATAAAPMVWLLQTCGLKGLAGLLNV